MNQVVKDRRMRLKRPLSILLVSGLCFLYPIINYWHFVNYYNVPLREFNFIMSKLNVMQIVLLFTPFIVAIGLYLVKKWGWYLFLIYSFFLISFNIYAIFKFKVLKNYLSLGEVVIVTILSIYFLRKDISAPYMKLYPRGFRGEKRTPIEVDIMLNMGSEKIQKKTRDLSQAGFYVDWEKCELTLNSSLQVSFSSKQRAYNVEVGVVRIDDMGVGFAFRNLTPSVERHLRKDFKL
jgi:hypothetical protein